MWSLNLTCAITSKRASPVTEIPLKIWPSVKKERCFGVVVWKVYISSLARVLQPSRDIVRLVFSLRKALNLMLHAAVSCARCFGKKAVQSGTKKTGLSVWIKSMKKITIHKSPRRGNRWTSGIWQVQSWLSAVLKVSSDSYRCGWFLDLVQAWSPLPSCPRCLFYFLLLLSELSAQGGRWLPYTELGSSLKDPVAKPLLKFIYIKFTVWTIQCTPMHAI